MAVTERKPFDVNHLGDGRFRTKPVEKSPGRSVVICVDVGNGTGDNQTRVENQGGGPKRTGSES